MMEENLDFLKIKPNLFEDDGWIVFIFLLILWSDPAMDKETLEKSLEYFKNFEKEYRPD